MTVLVAYAGRHGCTAAIAQRVGEVLGGLASPVDVVPVGQVQDLTHYRAVVLGSAVYMGRWMDQPRAFVATHAAALAARPVWLFSVGLAPQRPGAVLADATAAIDTTGARGHRYFLGRMDRRLLGLAERAVIASLGTPDGDSRDWSAIEEWATRVAADLAPGVAHSS